MRLGTSDGEVYREVFQDKDYALDLDFSPEIIVDAGANVGLAAVYFANRYPEARIVALEPEASNYAMLEKNARPWGDRIIPVRAALWEKDGLTRLALPANPSEKWMVMTRNDGSGDEVPAVTIKTLMERFRLPRIDLLKVDIEGAEIEVFHDTSWVPMIRSVVVETHDRFRPGCSETVRNAMEGFRKAQIAANVSLYTA